MEQELRAAVARGLHVENLWAIVGLCSDLLRAGNLHNPIIALALKAVCADLARAQESEAVPADYAELIDAHLLPAIEKLLSASSGTAHQLQDALNEARESLCRHALPVGPADSTVEGTSTILSGTATSR